MNIFSVGTLVQKLPICKTGRKIFLPNPFLFSPKTGHKECMVPKPKSFPFLGKPGPTSTVTLGYEQIFPQTRHAWFKINIICLCECHTSREGKCCDCTCMTLLLMNVSGVLLFFFSMAVLYGDHFVISICYEIFTF